MSVSGNEDAGFVLLDRALSHYQDNQQLLSSRRTLENAKKEAAMDRLFKGESLFALGSSEKLGVGVNIQQFLRAAHNVDINWRPDIKEQRDGRIWRQGNQWEDIDLYYYVTEGSFDTQMWQINNRKSKFIDQYVSGKQVGREITEEAGDSLDYATIMSIASGDPTLIERVRLEKDLKVHLPAAGGDFPLQFTVFKPVGDIDHF